MLYAQSSLFAAALTVCLFGSAIVVQSHNWLRLRFLIALLLIESAGFATHWLMIHPDTPLKSLWLTWVMGLSLLSAPCLWLFATELVSNKTARLSNLSFKHWVPILVGWFLLTPLLFSSHWGITFYNPAADVSAARARFTHITMLLCTLIFFIQVPIYLTKIARLMVEPSLGNLWTNVKQCYKVNKSLTVLVGVVGINWLMSAGRVLQCMLVGHASSILVIFTLIEVATIVSGLWVVLKPGILLAGASAAHNSTDKRLDALSKQPAASYAKSGLCERDYTRITNKLEGALKSEQLFLDNELDLNKLGQHINEEPRAISQIITTQLQTRFYDLVSTYRARYAAQMLLTNPQEPITNIAYNSGFNSKSTFNTAFKKQFNLTPSQYRQTNLK